MSSKNGTKSVWAQWKDKQGNWSKPVKDTIFLDSPPVAIDNIYGNLSGDYCSVYTWIPFTVFRNDYDPAGGKRFSDGQEFHTKPLGGTRGGHGDLSLVYYQSEWVVRFDCHHAGPFSDSFSYTIVDASGSLSTASVSFSVP